MLNHSLLGVSKQINPDILQIFETFRSLWRWKFIHSTSTFLCYSFPLLFMWFVGGSDISL